MQRRASPRIRVKDIYAKLRKNRFFGVEQRELARIVDLGPKGMGIEIRKNLPKDTKFFFVIDIPHKRKIKCTGVIKNSRKTERGHILGIEFTKLTKQDKVFLQNTHNILKLADIDYLDANAKLSDRIKLLRNTLRMTMVELAEASGVDTTIITQIENGTIENPPKTVLKNLAETMGSNLEALENHPLFLSQFKAEKSKG